MGKVIEETIREKDGDTKIIFKKSINSLFSYSRTCSGTSQLAIKSAILQRKKKIQKSNNSYYTEKGKIKRDLSIETDNCILRRYYRSKRNKMSTQGNSFMSKYSTVADTHEETCDQFADTSACGDIDVSACGDNEIIDPKHTETIYRADIGTLMINNFKGLLNQWVQNHVTYYNKDTQQKLDSLLSNILKKLDDPNLSESSSELTYVLHKEAHCQCVKNKKIATSSIACQYCNRKSFNDKVEKSISITQTDSSTPSISCYKDIRIISTLSIPRSFHKNILNNNRDKNRSSLYKCKKFKRKNVILSIKKSDKLQDTSSFDVVAVSKKSVHQCDTDLKKKKQIVFCPKSYYRTPGEDYSSPSKLDNNLNLTSFEINKNQLEEMPSLLRSVYTNEPATLTTSLYKNSQYESSNFARIDNFTMTEIISRDILTLDVSHVAVRKNISAERNEANIKYINKTKYTSTTRSNLKAGSIKKSTEKGKICRRRKHVVGTKTISKPKFSKASNRKFSSWKNPNNCIPRQQEFIECCQNVFQYLSKDNKNIKVDVRITVSPLNENESKDACTNMSNEELGAGEVKDPTYPYNLEQAVLDLPCIQRSIINLECEKDVTQKSSQNSPKFVPLLDGAVSQAKYIFDNVNSSERTEIRSNTIIDPDNNELEILQEISQLRAVIRDLATTAEKFVNEQVKREGKESCNTKSSSKCEVVINFSNASKETQIDNDIEKTQSANKKDAFEYYNRLVKKSTSYRIIDSESIVRVTDMTSKANKINKDSSQSVDKAMNCSLEKSKSLVELSGDNKLIAYFCDNKPDVDYSLCNRCRNRPKRCKSGKIGSKNKNWSFWPRNQKKVKSKVEMCYQAGQSSTCFMPLKKACGDSCMIAMNDTDAYCSTLTGCSTLDNEDVCRKGMGFGEGCVYCLFLWIPVIILSCILYMFVLKGKSSDLFAIKKVYPRKLNPAPFHDNSSMFYVKLSELGF